MKTLREFFRQTVRKIARATGQPVVAFTVDSDTPTGRNVGIAVEGASAEDLELFSKAILSALHTFADEGAATCPCCADRADRARRALEILRGDPGAPQPASVH